MVSSNDDQQEYAEGQLPAEQFYEVQIQLSIY